MAPEKVVALGLSERPSSLYADITASLIPVVDRAIELLAESLATTDEGPEGARVAAEFQRHRKAVAAAGDPEELGAASDECLKSCRAILTQVNRRRSLQHAEMTALVAMVKEAVSTIGGFNRTFSADLEGSTSRFEALWRIEDLRELKEQLATEVASLREMAQERQQAFRSTVSVFEQRLVDLEQKLAETEHEASVDPLTGALNRRGFDRTCQKWLQGGRQQFVIALFDLDGFKEINDTHGHPMGDRVLAVVAEALASAVRDDDIVARFGGDEFAVLASGLTLRQAEHRMKTVMSALLAASPIPDHRPALTLSCGIAECSAGDTRESLVHRADQALYEAKRLGKNRVATRATALIRDLKRR